MIKICRWVYGTNAPDDGIVMESAPREDGAGAWSGHRPARAQARWFRKSEARGEVQELAALNGIVAVWSAHERTRHGKLLQKSDLNTRFAQFASSLRSGGWLDSIGYDSEKGRQTLLRGTTHPRKPGSGRSRL